MKSLTSMRIRSLAWAATFCALTSAAAAAPTFEMTVLPAPPLPGPCSPTAINDLGHVLGTCDQSTFFWTPEDGMIAIPSPIADGYLSGRSLNNHDVVAAELHRFDGSLREGVLWDPVNGLSIFTPQDPALDPGQINEINDQGTVVGFGWVPTDPGTAQHAFVWTESTGVVDPWPDFGGYTDIRSINDMGLMLLWTIDEGGEKPWLLFGNERKRMDTAFCESGNAHGTSLNNLVQAAGVCTVGPTIHAAVWLTSRRGRDIDHRAESAGFSYAYGINDRAQVIGNWSGGRSRNGGPLWETTFYWDPGTRMISLQRLLDPADPLAAVTDLGIYSAINNAGQVATAGSVDGEWQLLLLTPVDE